MNIFDQTMANAAKMIISASDRDLADPNYSERVTNSLKIQAPKLQLGQTKTHISSEKVNRNNPPIGIRVSMSRDATVDFALYQIPFTGDVQIFSQLVSKYIDRNTTYVHSRNLCYKVYSAHPIEGNDVLIEQIKQRLVEFTDAVGNTLTEFETLVTNFEKEALRPQVTQFIEQERAKRNSKADSEKKLNPFT